ncbi:hypothetical protein WA158_005944 [Blastocystis sp. Blastoise]
MNDENGDDPNIIIKKSSYVHQYDINIDNNDKQLELFEFYYLSLSEELMKIYYRKNNSVKQFEEYYDSIFYINDKKRWTIKASEHNYSASEFHRYRDNKRETLTAIKRIGYNNHMNIFGGYTNQELI